MSRLTSSRPLIAVTTDYVTGKPHYMLPWTYADAVEKAGGVPVLLPHRASVELIPTYLNAVSGVVLSGGDDLDPALFGEERHLMAKGIMPERQNFEIALLGEIEKRKMPVLGVCLGSQIMHVHRGGSLHQFLPDFDRENPLEHRRIGDDWTFRHTVTIDPTSKLAGVLGTTSVEANSSHKQAVNKLGRGLRVTAHSPDGIIEATEDPSLPFYIGVQWHPERQNDEVVQMKLFEALVRQAVKYASDKGVAS